MAGNRRRIYWDANCFLYYINADPAWLAQLQYQLELASVRRTIEIVTSVISVTEVAFTAMEAIGRALSDEEEDRIDNLWRTDGITLVEVNVFVARLARELGRQRLERGWTEAGWRNPGAPDLIHLATAVFAGASEVHTTEPALHRYSALINIPVVYPPDPPPQPAQLPMLLDE